MVRINSLAFAALAALGLASVPAQATVVTGTFAGMITSGTDTTGIFTGQNGYDLVNLGGSGSPPRITGTFSYDTDVYPPDPDAPGVYGGADPFLSFTVVIGGTSYSFGALPPAYQGAYVQDDPDQFILSLAGGDDTASETFSIFLQDEEFLTGTDLPLSFIYRSVAGGSGNFVIQNGDDVTDAAFSVTCASADASVDCTVDTGTAVPEPAAWSMLIAGFGLVGGAIRRRRGLRCASA